MSDNQIESEIDNIILATTQNLESPELDTLQTMNTTNTPTITLDNANVEVFNTALHQYLRINEEIKTLMQAIKTRNEIKKNLGETLSSFLRTNQIKNVNLEGTYKGKRLESVVNTTVSGFNRTTVTEAIYNELKEDQEILDKIMQALSRTSIMKEVWKLKIVEEKQTGTTGRGRKKQSNVLDEANELLNK
jgi:D-hexose-6-phosphate mutarotase